jgi:geranylgeranyl pyrophosphate synthase
MSRKVSHKIKKKERNYRSFSYFFIYISGYQVFSDFSAVLAGDYLVSGYFQILSARISP